MPVIPSYLRHGDVPPLVIEAVPHRWVVRDAHEQHMPQVFCLTAAVETQRHDVKLVSLHRVVESCHSPWTAESYQVISARLLKDVQEAIHVVCGIFATV